MPKIQRAPKLAEWIANNYAAELNVPPRPDPSRKSISGKKCQGEYIYMVYVLYITCICRSYSCYIHVLT
jgi:hypothetical protein